ncbi:M13 family peptidase [Flaviaesturariibacter flavus]|uniref:M13 family peptidase n=1 Tax=Flaviaesturariibacter flavus TaxID=2502780 RepID=A0A4R1B3A5_9BACT|nr:M13 family metallopeptidase [Flaviaesturariibacter flavus]TCJ12524.1 M13 family peptidase [Flaviaesturariibacter flavus]
MRKLATIALLGLSAGLVAFTPPGDDKPKKKKYIDPANMDQSVRPGDNFYLYANGTWLKKNPVPASKTRWGSFDELREESSRRLRTLMEEAGKKSADPKVQQVADFYMSGMDTAAIDNLGYTPIKADLQRIDALNAPADFLKELVQERTQGMGSGLLGTSVGQDRKKVDQYIPSIGQGGITLPDRDYYLKNDTRSTNIRSAYREHVGKMFGLIGEDAATAARHADAVMRIETALAKAQYARVELRDPYKTYNKYAVKDLATLTPGIDWGWMLNEARIKGADSVIVSNPNYLRIVDVLLSALPMDDWKTYLKWNMLNNTAAYLSNDFRQQDFKLRQVLTGQKEMTPRWQFVSGLIDQQLGDQLGQMYVAKYFKPEAKERMLELVNNLQETFANRIKNLTWMSEATKQRALEKLNAFTRKIAYPDKWKDYSSITIERGDLLGNVRRSAQWRYNEMVGRIGKPVDRTEWGMTPPTINAYYSPSNNEIAFPAGILQFPFFDFGADDAVNYGGIGAVIGHEMTHGFDDSGRQYAANGNLTDWWTKADADLFKKRADEVVAQYNAFTVLDTVHVNGRLTLGENLADLGGLNMAYEAFTKTKQFKEGKKIDGFTPQQRFFLSWAQVWRSNATPEALAQLILTDPHSPGEHRANGPIVNMDAWYAAFNIQPGDKMYKAPEARTRIW